MLPANLADLSVSAILCSGGAARRYLSDRSINTMELSDDCTAESLLNTYRPALTVLGTSENKNSLALHIIQKCREQKIPSVAVIDLPVNSDQRFSGESTDPLRYAPDWLLVPDLACADSFKKLGFPEACIQVTGHPHEERLFSLRKDLQKNRDSLRRTLFPQLPVNRKIVTFVAEGYDLANPASSFRTESYRIKGSGKTNFRTAIVLEELLRNRSSDWFIVTRMHPKMVGDELSALSKEVDYFSYSENPLELMIVSDLVIGMTSMLLQEASILERPVCSILPRLEERDWLPYLAQGLIACATTPNEVQQLLQMWSADPVSLIPKLTSGPSGVTDSVVSFLTKLLRNSEMGTRNEC